MRIPKFKNISKSYLIRFYQVICQHSRTSKSHSKLLIHTNLPALFSGYGMNRGSFVTCSRVLAQQFSTETECVITGGGSCFGPNGTRWSHSLIDRLLDIN